MNTKLKKIKDEYPKSIIFQTSYEDWTRYKNVCLEKGVNAHGELRNFIKKTIKDHEKGL